MYILKRDLQIKKEKESKSEDCILRIDGLYVCYRTVNSL